MVFVAISESREGVWTTHQHRRGRHHRSEWVHHHRIHVFHHAVHVAKQKIVNLMDCLDLRKMSFVVVFSFFRLFFFFF